MHRVPAVAAGIALAAALTACGSHPARTVPPGTVTGIAAPCAGPPGAATRPVTVFAWRHGRIVATAVVHAAAGGGHYRLTLPAGRYLIGAPRSGDGAQPLTLHSGETVTVNFTNQCF
jgi:hypothetical protein